MTVLATLTTLAFATPPVHVVPNTPTSPAIPDDAERLLEEEEEEALELTMREWIGSTNTDPGVEFIDVAIEHERVGDERAPVMHVHGTVASRSREAAIVDHARSMKGIAAVDESLSVGNRDDGIEPVRVTPDLLGPDPEERPHGAVVEALLQSPFVDSRAIVVEEKKGRILLTGAVPRPYDIQQAEAVAERVVDVPVDVELTVNASL